MHLGVLWVQKVSKMRLGAVQILPRIFRTFLEFILIFPELILSIWRLENNFQEHQILYLVCSCLNLALGILLELLWFSGIFRAFKQFLVYTGIVFALKINSGIKKSYPFLPGRARTPDPLQPNGQAAKAQPSPATRATLSRAQAGHGSVAADLWRSCQAARSPAPL
jgi:hypothetical protein